MARIPILSTLKKFKEKIVYLAEPAHKFGPNTVHAQYLPDQYGHPQDMLLAKLTLVLAPALTHKKP